jgi:hypothetical protein
MIIQKASFKKAILFTLLFAALFVIINFTGIGVAGLLEITDGANILDFEFGYDSDKAYEMLTALGDEGRTFYLTKIMPIDFPFPFAYMLFYAGWMALFMKLVLSKMIYKYLLLLPVLAMLSDWIENIGIIAMLRNYPDLPDWAVYAASVSGILKTCFTVGSIAVIGVLFILIILKFVRKQVNIERDMTK